MDDEGADTGTTATFAYPALERVFHEKARLGLLVALSLRADGRMFTELRALCDLTDGNLNRHVHALEKEGVVEVWKRTSSGRSQTRVLLTDPGRQRFEAYLAALEHVLADAAPARPGRGS